LVQYVHFPPLSLSTVPLSNGGGAEKVPTCKNGGTASAAAVAEEEEKEKEVGLYLEHLIQSLRQNELFEHQGICSIYI
jgi:hypothetical protein